MGNRQNNSERKDSHGRTPLHNLLENLFVDSLWCKMIQFSEEIGSLYSDEKKIYHGPNKKISSDHSGDHENPWNLLSTPGLITTKNVNAKDKDKVTPYTWILLWQETTTFIQPGDLQDIQNLTTKMEQIDQIFLEKGARKKNSVKGLECLRKRQLEKVIKVLVKRWQEHANDEELLDTWEKEVQLASHRIRAIKTPGFTGYLDRLEWPQIFENTFFKHFKMLNENQLKISDSILEILSNGCNIQEIFDNYVKFGKERRQDEPINFYEYFDKLRAIVNKGAHPSVADISQIFRLVAQSCKKTNEMLLPAIQTIDHLIDAYRKNTNQINREPIEIYFNFLQGLPEVNTDLRRTAGTAIRAAYGSLSACTESNSVINILLFLSSNDDADDIAIAFLDANDLLGNSTQDPHILTGFARDTVEGNLMKRNDNWLNRNVLHLAAIFCHDEEVLKCIPQEIVEGGMNMRDIHGSTPLHVAYMHDNQCAIRLLESSGAESSTDHFGRTPQSLPISDASSRNAEADYKEHCKNILMNKPVFPAIKPMLVLPIEECEPIRDNFKKLFGRMVANNKWFTGEICIAGSVREKLKVCRFDEVDLQIMIHVTYEMFFVYQDLQIQECLAESLNEIDWSGIYLRPISVAAPWLFQWEGGGCYNGLEISVDVVPIVITNPEEYEQLPRQELIIENAPPHQQLSHMKWEKGDEKNLFPTICRHEWDILDNLAPGCRIGIMIAKTLLEAIDQASEKKNSLKMPVTSYVIKNALFWFLAGETPVNLHQTEGNIIGERYGDLSQKLTFEENSAKWLTEEDLQEHVKDGRFWAEKIFDAIHFFAKNYDITFDSFLLNHRLNRRKGLEAERTFEVVETSKRCLQRLTPGVFF